MQSIRTMPSVGTLRLTARTPEDAAGLRRAAERIRWLPDVLAVATCDGELQIVFRAPAEGLLRQVHRTLSAGAIGDCGFSEP